MSRLVDADEIIKELDEPLPLTNQPRMNECARWARDIAKSAIKRAPTVDAVPVIRCENCGHWHEDSWNYTVESVTPEFLLHLGYCDQYKSARYDTEFCSKARRKDDE